MKRTINHNLSNKQHTHTSIWIGNITKLSATKVASKVWTKVCDAHKHQPNLKPILKTNAWSKHSRDQLVWICYINSQSRDWTMLHNANIAALNSCKRRISKHNKSLVSSKIRNNGYSMLAVIKK